MSIYNPYYSHEAAEGVADSSVTEIKSLINDPQPTFIRMVVLETVSDPHIIDEDKISYWRNVLRVTNIRFAKVLPRNTIIAQRVLTGVTKITPPMFLLPFFPSHLSLPCKPGELVWSMFEDPNSRIKEMGYWFCRISEPHFIDDVNHTHHARQLDQSFNSTLQKRYKDEDKPVYELRNGKVDKEKDGNRFVRPDSKIMESDDADVFEKLITETDASKMIQYEAVPRFRKRPGDISLEGSNNTLIVLGTDRSGPVAKYNIEDSNKEKGIVPLRTDEDLINAAGSIDIVAGRGMSEFTSGQAASTKRIIDGEELKKEIGKSEKEISQGEGNPDFIQDRSRVLVAQKTTVDTKFGLDNYMNRNFNDIKDSEDGDAAVVIKSDKIRIVARSDISLIVTDYTDLTNSYDVSYKSEQRNESKWASITIRKNGDIIFTPSDAGVIKLGGEDANKAILCTGQPANNNEGTVSALPIATTGGGFVGTAGGNVDSKAVALATVPDLGTFSTKVLII